MGVWFLVNFYTGLHGKEHSIIKFRDTADSLMGEHNKELHFEHIISSRTKGNQISGYKFAVPSI